MARLGRQVGLALVWLIATRAESRDAADRGQQRSDPRSELRTAVALDPEDYRIWTELALESESAGDYAEAERCLLRAAELSGQFEPRWLLVNYYFRQGNAERFGRWAREALRISDDDPSPLFRLCRRMGEDAAAMEAMLPDRPEVWGSYLRYLVYDGRIAEARSVALRILAQGGSNDPETFLLLCERLLDLRQVERAAELWNAIGKRGLLRDGRGFAWHSATDNGITAEKLPDRGWRVRFSGMQPENCAVLWQVAPVSEGRGRLRFEYRTVDIAPGSGLRWVIADAYSGAEFAAGDALSAGSWTPGEVRFTAPPGVKLARIVLTYRRAPGTAGIEGAIEMRNVEVQTVE